MSGNVLLAVKNFKRAHFALTEQQARATVTSGAVMGAIAEAYHSRAWVALGYASWDDYCREVIHGLPPTTGTPEVRVAHVYMAQAGEGGPVKIGVAANVPSRIAQLQTGNAARLNLLAVHADGGKALERELHERHAADRLHGEWFRPSPAVLATVAEMASR